jgi:hypothetical protein
MLRAASVLIAAASLAASAQAGQGEALLQAGTYEVQVRLELPNVLSWTAAASTATVCLPADGANGALPVLSSNNPLAKCPASNVERDGAALRFDIFCPGRNAARGRAAYRLMPEAFEGRIAMVMGGKNMTMTEVQTGRRVGRCDLSVPPG